MIVKDAEATALCGPLHGWHPQSLMSMSELNLERYEISEERYLLEIRLEFERFAISQVRMTCAELAT